MSPNSEPSEKPLNLAKLKSGDDDEWDRAYDVLCPIAKAAAKAADHARTETELKSLAFEAVTKIKKNCIQGCKNVDHLKWTTATISRRLSINLKRKDTGKRSTEVPEDHSESLTSALTAEEAFEAEKATVLPSDDLIEAELLLACNKVLAWALSKLERNGRKTGKIYRTIVSKRYFDGLTIEETAKQMASSEGTVGAYGPRALVELSKIIVSDPVGAEVAEKFGFKRKENKS